MMKKISICFVALLLVSIFQGCYDNDANHSEGSIVNMNTNEYYSSIQDAINASHKGDTIFVYGAYYAENITIDKSIKLISLNNSVLDSQGKGDIVQILAENVTLKGFILNNSGFEGYPQFDSGIDIKSDSNIIANISTNGKYGIHLTFNADYNSIVNCTFENNEYGIYLYSAKANIIEKNSFENNTQYGTYFNSGSNNNKLINNYFYQNTIGCRIKTSDENIVQSNIFQKNEKGLYFCCGASDNIVYLNTFINNTVWHAQDYENNKWDNNSIGNYWSDYNGTDNDGNGIGDEPYNITCNDFIERCKRDNYPLMKPIVIKNI